MVTPAPPPTFSFQYRIVSKIIRSILPSFIKSNSSAAIDSIADVLSHMKLSNAEMETLLRASLGNLRGKEMPQGILDQFEDIGGGARHYSQEGEDILLARILSPDKEGFFVDIGAHHPLRFSNTYALYRKGWRGINVDAAPGSMNAFSRLRPEDINIECAVSSSDNPMTFYIFQEGALNTFESSLAQEYVSTGWALERTVEIMPRTLSSILHEHVPIGKHIDLLNIDVEGEEIGVLRSNDWHSYRPDLIILEVLATPFVSLDSHPTVAFLSGKGYEPVCRLINSMILRHRS
jgi:FkbM family methyltransferase